MTEQAIIKQIGKPVEIDFRKPKAIGSAGFYLKSFKAKNPESENLKLDQNATLKSEQTEFYYV